ncbi:class F sortase [Streptomyces sp. NK08204]|uniref:class F sortase n=1 Tax=Streptomyces sp. NK08204 TaxID=2873260 RepID=UPI0027E2FC3E|nr:class F sortase [Streptomyces sp. NK08204]
MDPSDTGATGVRSDARGGERPPGGRQGHGPASDGGRGGGSSSGNGSAAGSGPSAARAPASGSGSASHGRPRSPSDARSPSDGRSPAPPQRPSPAGPAAQGPTASAQANRAPGARPGTTSAPQAPRPSPLPRSRATALAIPYLSVDAPVMALRLDGEHRMTAPPDDHAKLVGWYQDGPSPGEQGTAVAVGHLDTDTGPAVFAGLSQLSAGRVIEVRRADGRTAVYTVDAVRTFEKAHFPDREVYGDRGRPELRLITCGGAYHRRTGYAGNVVVFAHLTGVRAPGTAVGAHGEPTPKSERTPARR